MNFTRKRDALYTVFGRFCCTLLAGSSKMLERSSFVLLMIRPNAGPWVGLQVDSLSRAGLLEK
jgi:hypothetical protein